MGYIDDLISKAKGKKEEQGPETEDVQAMGRRKRVATYGDVQIFQEEGKPLLIYSVPVTKSTGPEKIMVNTIQEAATRLITVSPEEFRDPKSRRAYYNKRVKELIQQSPELRIPATKIDFYTEMVVQEMIGYGVLDDLVSDPNLEEIMVIGPKFPVYVFHREHEMMETNIVFGKNEEINNIVSRIARQVNRRVDMQDPLLDARLQDGSRVNATMKPISVEGSTLTIRKFKPDPYTLIDLVKYNTMDLDIAAFLWYASEGAGFKPANILISGGTSSGKTTTLNVLSSLVPPDERVITLEDTAELMLPVKHWIRFETRPPGLEGTGEITMEALMKNALRMRPDRVIVGEVRGEEAFTMFTAMNTGHDGSLGTIHANSADETLTRIIAPPMSVPKVMVKALDFIIIQQRVKDPKKGMIRRITEIAEVVEKDGNVSVNPLWTWNPVGDKFVKSKTVSKFEETALKYTGKTSATFNAELKKRKDVLQKLVSGGKRDLKSFSHEIHNYYMQGKGIKVIKQAPKAAAPVKAAPVKKKVGGSITDLLTGGKKKAAPVKKSVVKKPIAKKAPTKKSGSSISDLLKGK